MYVGIVDFAVHVNQSVAELRHLPQLHGFFRIQYAILFKHLEGIRIVLWGPKMLRCNNVIGYVQATFDAYLQVVFCASTQNPNLLLIVQ